MGCGSRSSPNDTSFTRDASVVTDASVVKDASVETGLDDAGVVDASPVGCTAVGQVVMASGENYPRGLAVNTTHLYWGVGDPRGMARDGMIRAQPKSGGAIVTLASNLWLPREVRVDLSRVFWTNQAWGSSDPADDTSALHSVPLQGGSRTPFKIAASWHFSADVFASSTQDLYVDLGAGNEQLDVISKGSGVERAIFTGTNQILAVVADDDGVYWVRNGAPYGAAILALPKGALAASALSTVVDNGYEASLALDKGWVYFATTSNIYRLARTGGSPELLIKNQYATRIAIDSSRLYWATTTYASNDSSNFSLHKTTLSGSGDVIIATGAGRISHLESDGRCVYWTNVDAGKIEAVSLK